MTDPALPANDPPPPDDAIEQMIVTIDDTGAATHVGCGGDVYTLTDDDKRASCDKCKLVVGVEAISVVPEAPEIQHVTPEQLINDPLYKTIDGASLPPEIIGEELHERSQESADSPPIEAYTSGRARRFDTSDETPAPLPEPTYRDPQCIDRHLSGCGCTGDARAPI